MFHVVIQPQTVWIGIHKSRLFSPLNFVYLHPVLCTLSSFEIPALSISLCKRLHTVRLFWLTVSVSTTLGFFQQFLHSNKSFGGSLMQATLSIASFIPWQPLWVYAQYLPPLLYFSYAKQSGCRPEPFVFNLLMNFSDLNQPSPPHLSVYVTHTSD